MRKNRERKSVLDKEFRRELKNRELKKKDTFIKKLYYPVFKRTADIVCSLICLIVLIILFPIISIAIKLDSKGPIFFSQVRVGQRGYLFNIYKFRTMYVGSENSNPDVTDKNMPFVQHKNDRRVTRVGNILRKTSMDELPQLFCVLSGKMSFIGPRPFIPGEVAQLKRIHLYRLMVKPGLTGLAQISGRNSLNLQDRMDKDLEYIRRMSPWLDIKILLKTIFKVVTNEGAS